MDLYAENILDHYRHPRRKLPLPAVPAEARERRLVGEGWGEGEGQAVIQHQETNISCGDELTLQLRFDADHIVDVAWTGTGCAISQAGTSMLAEELIGKTTTEIAAMTSQTMFDLLGVPISARRLKCALLSLHVLKNALHKACSEQPQDWNETMKS